MLKFIYENLTIYVNSNFNFDFIQNTSTNFYRFQFYLRLFVTHDNKCLIFVISS